MRLIQAMIVTHIEIRLIQGVNRTPRPSSDLRALIRSIRCNGVQCPIAVHSGTFQVITGHTRVLACKELGMTSIPAYLLECHPNSPEARLYIIDSELEHAKLSTLEQALLYAERKKIYQSLFPQTAKGVAGAVVRHTGASDKLSFANSTASTVGKNRRTVERKVMIGEHIAPTIAELLLAQANSLVSKLANNQRDLVNLVRDPVTKRFRTDEEQCAGIQRYLRFDQPTMKHFDKANTISRAFMQLAREAYTQDHGNIPLEWDDYKLWHGDFEELCKRIPDGSISAIITDVPWDGTFLDRLPGLAATAIRVLKDGGHLAILPGQQYLMDFYAIMRELTFQFPQLRYRWEWSITSPKGSPSAKLAAQRTITHSKPIALFSKGKGAYGYDTLDTIYSKRNAQKRWHGWQQPWEDMEPIVLRLTEMGDTVLDVCNGGGSTGIAALRNYRKYIGCDIEESCIAATRARFHHELPKELIKSILPELLIA